MLFYGVDVMIKNIAKNQIRIDVPTYLFSLIFQKSIQQLK